MKEVSVTQIVSVAVDESKFTPEFMAAYRESFYDFRTIDEHVAHLAQLHARGLVEGIKDDFIEGYGTVEEFGIVFNVVHQSEEVLVP